MNADIQLVLPGCELKQSAQRTEAMERKRAKARNRAMRELAGLIRLAYRPMGRVD